MNRPVSAKGRGGLHRATTETDSASQAAATASSLAGEVDGLWVGGLSKSGPELSLLQKGRAGHLAELTGTAE